MSDNTLQLASRWRRLAGAFIDAIIVVAIILPLIMPLNVWPSLSTGKPLTLGQQLFNYFLSLFVFLVVNGYLLFKHGQTVGKKLVRTRIVRVSDGAIPALPRLLVLRYLPIWLVGYIPVVGSYLVLLDELWIFRADKRCLHDLIAGTKVINA